MINSVSTFSKKLIAFCLLFYILLCLFLLILFAQIKPVLQGKIVFSVAPDFKSIQDIDQRKQIFFDFLLPLIQAKNLELRQTRNSLLEIEGRFLKEKQLRSCDLTKLEYLSKYFDVDPNLSLDLKISELKKRINIIPPAMVLAQAAKESAWGMSRFARIGNNYFGEWCFTPGCGIVPNKRRDGAEFEVRKFSFPKQSVNSYFLNINSHSAYEELRELRHQSEQQGGKINPLLLIEGLTNYSQRGKAYIDELRTIIISNKLEQLNE